MGIDVPTILDALLEATADEATAKARIASLRASLEEEARRRFQTERAAPSWNAPDLGKVRFEPPGKWEAMVADDAAWGSWVAEHHPSEATGVIRLPAEGLAAVLEAIEFIGIPGDVTSTVEVRPAWSSTFLGSLAVDVEEGQHPVIGSGGVPEEVDGKPVMAPADRTFTVTDPTTGVVVEGVTGTRTAPKLVVTLDKDRRTHAIETAKAAAGALLEVAQTDEGPEVDRQELDERRRYLEGLHADVLAAYAARLELSKSGTKAELAERIARTEAITGRRDLIPGSAVGLPAEVPVVVSEAAPRDTVTIETHDHRCPVDCGPEHDRAMEEDADRQLAEAEDVCGETFDHDTSGANPYECRRCGAELEQPDDEAPPSGVVDEVLEREAAILTIGSREDLRAFAKAKNIAPSGTKPDVAHRIAAAGHTADDVTDYLAQETTP